MSRRVSQRAGTAGAPSRRARTGQHHLSRGHGGGDEVVRGLADDLLRRGQPDLGPHRPRQPGAGIGRRRPHALDQAAEHHDVRALQPRLQQAPDEHARMLAPVGRPRSARRLRTASPSSTASSRPGSVARGWSGQQRQGVLHRGEAGGERFAFLAGPQPGGAGFLVGGGEAFGGLDQRGERLGRGRLPATRRCAGRVPGSVPAAAAGRRRAAAAGAVARARRRPVSAGAGPRAAQTGAVPGHARRHGTRPGPARLRRAGVSARPAAAPAPVPQPPRG